MTNHWADLDNASMFFVMGANPVENHPASMAHVNAARYGAKKARLVVVDPRKTRTAMQADLYVRIRPGTNIAFINGVLNYIFTEGYTNNPTFAANFDMWHNSAHANFYSNGRAFRDDAGSNAALVPATGTYATSGATGFGPIGAVASRGWPKYTDSRFKVAAGAAPVDYQRETFTVGTRVFSNFPVVADTIGDPDCVMAKLKKHVEWYTKEVTADICGCAPSDIAAVGEEFIANCRMTSSDFSAALSTPQAVDYKAATIMYAMGITQHTSGSQNIRDFAILQTMLGNMGRPGGGINALRGIHNVQGSTDMGVLFDLIPGYSGNPGTTATWNDYVNPLFGNRTHPDATGGAVFAYKPGVLGLQQRGFYNMVTSWFGPQWNGRPGVGHTVTDQAVTMSNTTAKQLRYGTVSAVDVWSGAGGTGTHFTATTDYTIDAAAGTITRVATGGITDGQVVYVTFTTTQWSAAEIDKLYALWPKGNGNDHITTFREMKLGNTKAAVVWGQNPAVTEPNQSVVRDGLEALDLLVVVDIFATETAMCKRQANGVTYLLPAAAHVEEAGSVTNSGRWIQWRQRARVPHGNSKADLELLLRFAKALDTAGAFSHITDQWATMGTASPGTSAYDVLYKDQYGYDGTGNFEAVTRASADGIKDAFGNVVIAAGGNVTGSEAVAENIFQQMGQPLASGGSLWLWTEAYNTATASARPASIEGAAVDWTTVNRAKSRDNVHKGEALNYPRWGYSWLVNRRVLYNNSEVPSDEADTFVAPDVVARLFTVHPASTLVNYAFTYRAYNTLKDVPTKGADATVAKTDATKPHKYAGRFPAHTEPIETPRRDLAHLYGRNTALGAALVKTDTNVALWSNDASEASYNDPLYTDTGTWNKDAASYPYVLTTIRCVEHFQGGPITRNNSWNVEAEPVPWIEINSVDARREGIKDGDWVNIITPRSNSTTLQEGRTNKTGWAKGFKARVGVGLQANQRVAPGVVAIPWHWGDQGLGTGSRANDLCIDSFDANTIIPEYKACLCRITTVLSDETL